MSIDSSPYHKRMSWWYRVPLHRTTMLMFDDASSLAVLEILSVRWIRYDYRPKR